ncbi:acyl transferase [Nocardia sp. NPDC059091]|uniref:acyl transferase n=1 Tax=unclassified Nocardia TaxID=2637762 RepID=UPI003691A587
MRSTHVSRRSIAFALVGQRAGVTVLGVLTCAAAVAGCTTTSTVSPTSQPSTTAAATATTTVPGSVPETTLVPTTSSVAEPPVVPTRAPSKQPESSTEPQAGKTFPGEGLTAQQARDLQQGVDSGHQPWRLDRVQVAKAFVQQRFGWATVQAAADGPTSVVVTNQDGSKLTLQVGQPVTQGSRGIWVVDSGAWD